MILLLAQKLEVVFFEVLRASWQASVLVVFVLLIQRILGSRLNPRWRYALWLLVILRLVVPVLPPSSLSFYHVFPATPEAFRPFADPYIEKIFFPGEPLNSMRIVTPPATPNLDGMIYRTHGNGSDANYVRSVANAILALTWLAGAVLLALLTWMVNRRFARQVANSPAISDPELLKLFAGAKAELGIRRAIRLIENGQVQSPAIMGLFQPTLLLPADVRGKFDATELRLIFLHELAHLKRGDVIVQGIIALLQILHWFNPVLWFAFRRMRIDREPATDALVLSRTGEEEKERYGLMLIKLLEHFNQRHSLPTLVGILEDKDQFKRRFALIARFTRGAYGWSLLGVFIIALLSAACLTKSKATEGTIPPSATVLDANQQMRKAILKGDVVTLQKLIDQGVDPKKAHGDRPGETLLFYARSPEVAEILIQHGVDVNASSKNGETALDQVCMLTKKPAEIVQVLLKHGADPNARDNRGATPLTYAPDGATVDVLIKCGADIKAKSKESIGVLLNPLGDASRLEALIRHGVPFDPKIDGPTLMMEAAWRDRVDVIAYLLSLGVDPNLKGTWNKEANMYFTPLQESVTSGHLDAAKFLLEHGAKVEPDIVNGKPEADEMVNALYNRRKDIVKLFWEHGVRSISELTYAISQGQSLGDVQKLLDGGIPPDPPQDKDISPLGVAAELGRLDVVTLLVQRGAKVKNLTDRENPLALAAMEGQDEVVDYLLHHGAQVDYEALWNAVWNCHPYEDQRSQHHFEKTVKLLIDTGALKKMTREQNGKILDAAIETRTPGGNATVLKMLVDAGLSPELPLTDESGKKLNSVIGYYRDWCLKHKDDTYIVGEIKPLLDMLEAAEKGSAPKTDASVSPPPAAHGNPALNQALIDVARDGRTDKVGKGDADKIAQLLDQGADANAKGKDGTTALVWALNFGKDDAAQELFEHGADGSGEDSIGENAAWLAAKIYYCPGALDLMIKKGGKVTGENKNGRTILVAMMSVHAAQPGKMNYLNDRIWTADEMKAYEDRERRTVELLIAAGVDFQGKDGATTPLMAAVKGGHVEAVRALLEHGANASFKDAEGNTALSLAQSFHPELVPLLEAAEKGSAPKADAPLPNAPPVHLAASAITGETQNQVSDEGRLYHALVYRQTSSAPAQFVTNPYQFIADIRNTVPNSTGTVSLPPEAAWPTNPVTVVAPDNLIGAHFLYSQGFPSMASLLAHFPNGNYAFNITRKYTGGHVSYVTPPVPFSGSVNIPSVAPVITNDAWNSGALVLQPSSAVIHFTSYPGATLTWEIVGEGMSAGGSGTSDGMLNLTGLLSPGQTYQGQLRFIHCDSSVTVSNPQVPIGETNSNYTYSTIAATIVQFTIKTPTATTSTGNATLSPAKADAGAPAANLSPPHDEAKDIDALKKYLLEAKEDADARRVLVASVKDLPDDQFRATLAGLNRQDSNITALQKEIADMSADIVNLLNDGFMENHPRIQAMRRELTAKEQQMKDLTAGTRKAMAIDLQMADSRVAFLTKELVENIAKTQQNQASQAAPTSPSSLSPSQVKAAPGQGSDQIEISLKVAEIEDDVYLANKEKIDAAVKNGDIGFFINLKGMRLLSAPSVTTQPGLKANIDIVRELPFPVSFEKNKDGKFTPTEFSTRNCGVTAVLTPTKQNGKVQVSGMLMLTTFEGFTFNGVSNAHVGSPTFRTTETYIFEEIDHGGQIKGVLIPGIQHNPPAATQLVGTPNFLTDKEGTLNRLIVFLSAKQVR